MREQFNEKSSERHEAWEVLRAEVEGITDKLGKGIDPGIKKSVIALNAFHFPTCQSCEGHAQKTEGSPYPWVEISIPEPDRWEESEEIQEGWLRANLGEQQKLIHLLDEFYKDRETPFDVRLVLSRIGAFGGFRVQSAGADTMLLLSEEELNEKRAGYQEEMREFAQFLKNKFLAE